MGFSFKYGIGARPAPLLMWLTESKLASCDCGPRFHLPKFGKFNSIEKVPFVCMPKQNSVGVASFPKKFLLTKKNLCFKQ